MDAFYHVFPSILRRQKSAGYPVYVSRNFDLAHTLQLETHQELFPWYLYKHNHVYNPEDEETGLFFGHYILNVHQSCSCFNIKC